MPLLNTGPDFVGGTDALAAEVNARFDAIETWANVTKLDGANLQDNIITNAKMADDSVGAAELIDDSVGLAALNIPYHDLKASADLALTTSYQTVPGLSVTPAAGSYLAIVSIVVTLPDELHGIAARLSVGGTPTAVVVDLEHNSSTASRKQAMGTAATVVAANGSQAVLVEATKTTGSQTSTVRDESRVVLVGIK